MHPGGGFRLPEVAGAECGARRRIPALVARLGRAERMIHVAVVRVLAHRWQATVWWSILRNSGVVLGANFVSKVLVFAATAAIARALGPQQFGWYYLILTYVGFAAILSDLGMDAILTRDMARHPRSAGDLLGGVVTLRALSVTALIVIAFVGFRVLEDAPSLRIAAAVALIHVLSFSLGAFAETYFRSRMAVAIPSAGKVIAKATLLVLALMAFRGAPEDLRLMVAIGVTVLPDALATMAVFMVMWREARPTLAFGWTRWKPLLTESWPVALTAVAVVIYLRVDVLLLGRLTGPQAVGNYAAAFGLVEVGGGIATALGVSLLPAFSQMVGDRTALGFWPAYRQSLSGLMFLLIPVACFCTIYAEEVVGLVYGPRFVPAAPALRLLAWSQIFASAGVVYTSALTAQGRQRLLLGLALASAVVNVLTNLVLIPPLGIAGAAIATMLAYGTGSVILWAFRSTRAYIAPLLGAALIPLVASGIFAGVVLTARMPMLVGLMAGGGLYLAAAAALYRASGAWLKPGLAREA